MKSLSISFTLGKGSKAHSINLQHNNREFLANNIDPQKLNENIKYIAEDPELSYDKLFSEALKEYNEKQKQPCRKIMNYYEHVLNSKREEAFYEAIVQFGDSETTSFDFSDRENTKKMLDEYMKDFRKRNPNLYVFNAIMHNDEATPHLHIDFIPFYTKNRQKGLSKGVSLKSALIEQGFLPTNAMKNQVVAWEENERNVMEKILNKHGYEREIKNANYAHMNVDQYKALKEEMKSENSKILAEKIARMKRVFPEDLEVKNVAAMKEKLSQTEYENKKLSEINKSDFVPCYYSDSDKLAYVQTELDKRNIQYFETATGLEIKKCYLDIVREAEKNFKPVRSPLREKLRNDIDRLLLSSDSVETLLKKLEEEHYTIKNGKYISVLPDGSDKYIRLKSLGEMYNELALKNRIAASRKFEIGFNDRLKNISGQDTLERYTVQTICMYFVGIRTNKLPCTKINQEKPFAWKNDAELDKLLILNEKINSGITLESLHRDFESKAEKADAIISEIEEQKKFLAYLAELKKKIEIVYENKSSDPDEIANCRRELDALEDFSVTKENYKNIYDLIVRNDNNLNELEEELNIRQNDLKEAAEYYEFAQKVASGTYVQELARNEQIRRVSDYVPSGMKLK